MFPVTYFSPYLARTYWPPVTDGGSALPAMPSSLRAKRVAGTIELTWADNALGETEYYVHRGAAGFTPSVGTRYSADLGPGANAYVDGSPPAGTPWYVIEVVNPNGSTYSRRFSFNVRRRRLPPGFPG